MTTALYILGDGDRVRERIERYLFAGDLQGLASFSSGLTAALVHFTAEAGRRIQAETVMAGGDEFLLQVSEESYDRAVLAALAADFRGAAGCSLSLGVSRTVVGAYLNLRRSKAAGGATIVEEAESLR